MGQYSEFNYHSIGGNCELGGAALGLVAGLYFAPEIKDTITSMVHSSGLVSLLNKEPVLTKLGVGASGLFAGYYAGKVLGKIAIYFRKRDDQKKVIQEKDARTEWLEQIQNRSKKK